MSYKLISLWPDLQDEERIWAFQRLNVYCIVAALGWPAATAACASTSATTDFVLPPGVVLPQPAPPQRRGRREQQPVAAVQQPMPAPQQRQQQQRQREETTKEAGAEEQPTKLQFSFRKSLLFLIFILLYRPSCQVLSGSLFIPVSSQWSKLFS